ncbi:MAG: ribosome maturation factor RimP [Legionellales bacterium]|nr:ribosome maturation factor RimP [Legionellales bacterium]|tara:strand:+ start:182 stop:634 length:453 start_codon:yes stop_codon:yes gene_type:complete
MAKTEQLNDMLKPVVEALGYGYWGCEYLAQGKHSVLRVYIDKPDGISLDDCVTVSRQVSAVLDVEDPINGEYSLEVSSPGSDRRLFTLEQCKQAIGDTVHIRLHAPLDGQRKLTGVITAVSESHVTVNFAGDSYEIEFSTIDKANIVPLT